MLSSDAASGRHPSALWRAAVPLVSYLITFVVLLLMNFALPRAMPGDPLQAALAQGSPAYLPDPQQQAELRRFYDLDQGWAGQLADYLSGLVHGDLGVSLHYRVPVTELLAERVPRTLLLILTALGAGGVSGVVIGSRAGWRRGGVTDLLVLAASSLLRGVPVFFLAGLVSYVFAIRLGWFPVSGYATRFVSLPPWERALDIGHHLVLPAGVLALYQALGLLLLARAATVQQLGAPHLLTARACGLSERRVRRRHVTRVALTPVVSRIGAQAGLAITGAVLVESVFAYAGAGSLLVDAIGYRDYPLLQGCFLLLTTVVLISGAAADIVAYALDPRTSRS